MSYFFICVIENDTYHVHMRGANIAEILRNNYPVEYDHLSLRVREALLIEALKMLSKLKV